MILKRYYTNFEYICYEQVDDEHPLSGCVVWEQLELDLYPDELGKIYKSKIIEYGDRQDG